MRQPWFKTNTRGLINLTIFTILFIGFTCLLHFVAFTPENITICSPGSWIVSGTFGLLISFVIVLVLSVH